MWPLPPGRAAAGRVSCEPTVQREGQAGHGRSAQGTAGAGSWWVIWEAGRSRTRQEGRTRAGKRGEASFQVQQSLEGLPDTLAASAVHPLATS